MMSGGDSEKSTTFDLMLNWLITIFPIKYVVCALASLRTIFINSN